MKKHHFWDSIHIWAIVLFFMLMISIFLIFDKYNILWNSNLSYDFWITFASMSIPLFITMYIYIIDKENKSLEQIENKSGIKYEASYSSIIQQHLQKVEEILKIGVYIPGLNFELSNKVIQVEENGNWYILILQCYVEELLEEIIYLDNAVANELEQNSSILKFNICAKLKYKKLAKELKIADFKKAKSINTLLRIKKEFQATEEEIEFIKTINYISYTQTFNTLYNGSQKINFYHDKFYKFKCDPEIEYHISLLEFLIKNYSKNYN